MADEISEDPKAETEASPSQTVLNKDPNTCYMCSEAHTEWVSFASKHKYTKMYLCKAHYDGLGDALLTYMKAEKNKCAST